MFSWRNKKDVNPFWLKNNALSGTMVKETPSDPWGKSTGFTQLMTLLDNWAKSFKNVPYARNQIAGLPWALFFQETAKSKEP